MRPDESERLEPLGLQRERGLVFQQHEALERRFERQLTARRRIDHLGAEGRVRVGIGMGVGVRVAGRRPPSAVGDAKLEGERVDATERRVELGLVEQPGLHCADELLAMDREAIGSDQRRSEEAIRSNQKQSEAIRSNQKQSEAIRSHPERSKAIKSHRKS